MSRIDEYFRVMVEERLFSNERNLRFHQRTLFDGIDFSGKTMLDVGAGPGLMGFYAACSGAAEVVCLEPEADGSTAGVVEAFRKTAMRLRSDNIRIEATTLQSFDAGSRAFDVILLHNSVNHLDAEACETLLERDESRQRYRQIFGKLKALASPGATLMINDCSRHNLFGDLALRNPLMPMIRWNAHQAPEVWAGLLAEVGFKNPRIRWSAFNALGSPGQFMLGNKAMAYLLKSHFWLRMDRAN